MMDPEPSPDMAQEGEGQLMLQSQQGDTAAFAELVRRHEKAVYAYLRARLLQASDAEDLAQEVFLRCYQARARFDTDAMVRPFLMGISRNVLREHVRKLQRRKEIIWTEMCLELDAQQEQEEETRMYDDVLTLLPDCLEHLGENARSAVEMHYKKKMKHAQIGEVLMRSVGAVKLLLFRARKALKRCLDDKMSPPAEEA